MRATSLAALCLVLGPFACHRTDERSPTPAEEAATPAIVTTPPPAPTPPTTPDSGPSSGASPAPDASPARGFICFPPMTGDFDRCPKGAMRGDEELRACIDRAKASAPRRPTFHVAGSASSTFSPTKHRCAEVALDVKTHVTVDTLAGLDESVPSTCVSHAIDMQGPNFYGAIFFRCATRDRSADEVVAHE